MSFHDKEKLELIVALAKRRGFLFQGSELYGGLAGTFDYGPLGVLLKRNIINLWWSLVCFEREDMYPLDAALIMRPEVWKASGHVDGFADPLVSCSSCGRQFREDQLEDKEKCPECGGKLGSVSSFNMMFTTKVGPASDAPVSYLRPETAQGMFVNVKNIIDSLHPKLPFGLAQVGKAFRNEIAPRDFLFRAREFEQMEVEYFVRPEEWKDAFLMWRDIVHTFLARLNIQKDHIHELEVPDGERAHYSARTIDFEYEYPFGKKELFGLAYRTDFDLASHQNASGVSLEYFDEETKERFIPHVIEPSFGVERTLLAVLCEHYKEDEVNGEKRVFLSFPKEIAPYRAAVFPLLKNKPELVLRAREVYSMLKKTYPHVLFDDNGNIGKRYRRQDEIGTPFCITIDFDTLGEHEELKDTVTIRDRDTGEQKRVHINDLVKEIS